MTPQALDGGRLTVWFDGDCPLCVREIALMRRLDRAGAVDFQDMSQTMALAPGLDRCALLQRLHAQAPGQPMVSGAAAFAALWRAIPVLRPLGLLAQIPPVLWLLEQGYVAFLKIRPRLQALVRKLERRRG